MLEIKGISKTYYPKKGVPVTALDNVSLSFGNKGLVFILGKSGSGKSTLLNVIGGLDKAEEGEFIIKGKSSLEFKSGDFDSYRNTFIGFVFQEYNILSEFSVGQNIALAMELQGRKASSEHINNILKRVGLEGHAGRNPTELSGGQKQRIAIARALIKEPEIIMADEPTGALDSNTSKQVFETLKKLSKTKLVLVVSHDREFAEYYGDRVIELQDGEVISDILKYDAKVERESEGLSVVGGDILHIKENYELTEKDIVFISNYLKKQRGETIISSDIRANTGLKHAAMMSDNGEKESFKDITEATEKELFVKNYDKSETIFLKSRLPYRKALKIGASSLKTKPLRLFITILLAFVSLAMFGLADTFAAYDKVQNTILSIKDAELKTAYFRNLSTGLMTDGQLGLLNEQTSLDFKSVFMPTAGSNNAMSKPNLIATPEQNSFVQYYNTSLSGMYELEEKDLQDFGASLVFGRLPKSDDEIAIPKYVYETYNKYGYTDTDKAVVIKSGQLTADNGSKGFICKKTTS